MNSYEIIAEPLLSAGRCGIKEAPCQQTELINAQPYQQKREIVQPDESDGPWRRSAVVLKPLNSSYTDNVIAPDDADRLRVVAELLATLK